VVRAIGTLQDVQRTNPREQISDVLDDISSTRVDIAAKKDDIDEINESIDASEAKRATSLRKDEEKLTKKIGIKEEAIESEQEKLTKAEENLDKLQDKLDRMSDGSFTEEKERRKQYEDLFDLFDEGVSSYRDELRDRVEEDASDIFLELTTEPEYERLEINENYGLTIVHESGDRITVRSSGAEHVVALALMGALQNNAPLKGPIIMDSPFGRLDSGHVRNVVEALPNLTDQVLLLVYRDELDQEEAREILGGQLRKEYSMRRESARHTKLVEGGKIDD
jgi:DNA sulfur modification protein DndD